MQCIVLARWIYKIMYLMLSVRTFWILMLCLHMQDCEYCRLYSAILNCGQLKDGAYKTDLEKCIKCYNSSNSDNVTFEALYSNLVHEELRSSHLIHAFGQVLYTQFHGKGLSL